MMENAQIPQIFYVMIYSPKSNIFNKIQPFVRMVSDTVRKLK